MNIVNMAMNYLGPAIISKIASSMGMNNTVVNGLISAALPTVLGSLTGTSRTGAGAGALFDMVKDMAWGGSNNNSLEQAIDGGSVADFSKGGADMLGGLLGGNTIGNMASALGRANGVTSDQAGSILGMIGPVALGALRDRVDEDGMDAAGLAQFLGDQKANVAGAMPASFAGELQSSGLLDSMGDVFGSVTGGVSGAVDAAGNAVSGVADAAGDAVSGASSAVAGAAGAAAGVAGAAAATARDAASGAVDTAGDAVRGAGNAAEATAKKGMGIMPWIILALILAALAWYFYGRGGADMDMAEMPSADSIMVGDVNISDKFNTGLESVTGALGSVTDAASAEAALPQIEAFGTSLDEIGGMEMPDSAKGIFGGLVSTAIGSLQPLIDSVLGMDGVGDILGPVLPGIMEKLTALAG